jgi:hypothetical protein
VGSARCAECHRPISRDLLASRHASTFSRARELRDLPLPGRPLPDPAGPEVVHEFRWEADSLRVETRASDRVFRGIVAYAFGSRDHLMTLVGRDDQGVERMFRMSHYDSARGSGWDLSTGLPPRPAREDEYLGERMVPRDGLRRCLSCHTTNFRAIVDESGPEAADHSIGCESCHGPGGHHEAAVEAGLSDLAIANAGGAQAVNAMCGRCHNIDRASVISAPRTAPAWYRFPSLTMTWSRCYTESDERLSCVTCHDPHRNAETSAARNEAKCLSCHAADPATRPPADERRTGLTQAGEARGAGTICPVNPAKGCLECHMPRVWVPSTHSFKTDHFIRVRDRTPSEAPSSPRRLRENGPD